MSELFVWQTDVIIFFLRSGHGKMKSWWLNLYICDLCMLVYLICHNVTFKSINNRSLTLSSSWRIWHGCIQVFLECCEFLFYSYVRLHISVSHFFPYFSLHNKHRALFSISASNNNKEGRKTHLTSTVNTKLLYVSDKLNILKIDFME